MAVNKLWIPTPSTDRADKMREHGNIHEGLFTRRDAKRFLGILGKIGIQAETDHKRGHETTIHLCITDAGGEHRISGEDNLFDFMCRQTDSYGSFLKAHWNTPRG